MPSVAIFNLLIKEVIFVWRFFWAFELIISYSAVSRLADAVLLIFTFLLSYGIYSFLIIIRIGRYSGFPVLFMSGHIYKYFRMIGIDVSDINIDRWWRWNLFCHVFVSEENHTTIRDSKNTWQFVTYLKANNCSLITIS